MDPVMGMSAGLIQQTDRVEHKRRFGMQFGRHRDPGQLDQLDCRAVISCLLLVIDRRQIDDHILLGCL